MTRKRNCQRNNKAVAFSLMLLLVNLLPTDAFMTPTPKSSLYSKAGPSSCTGTVTTTLYGSNTEGWDDDDSPDTAIEDDDDDLEALFEYQKTPKPLDGMERAWRYAKKPLLHIGSKGAHLSHGNSLRQLLEDHTVVKVKVNTRRFGGSLQEAFEHLRDLAEESGAVKDIELVQARDGEKIILFGMPGTLEKIRQGTFPPPELNNNRLKNNNNEQESL